jgi:hypothetical protein
MMPGAGLAIAFLVDLAIPLALAIWLAILNHRAPKRRSSDAIFWSLVGAYLGIVALGVWVGIAGTYAYSGIGVVIAVVLAFPGSLVPAIFNSNVIHFFFTSGEWARVGYLPVLTFFLLGLLAWAALLPLGIRRLAQSRSPLPLIEVRV